MSTDKQQITTDLIHQKISDDIEVKNVDIQPDSVVAEIKIPNSELEEYSSKSQDRKNRDIPLRSMILFGNGLCRSAYKNSDIFYYNKKFNLYDIIYNDIFLNNNFAEIKNFFDKIIKPQNSIHDCNANDEQLNIEDALGLFETLAGTQKALGDSIHLKLETLSQIDNHETINIQKPDDYKINEFRYQILKKISQASEELREEKLFQEFQNKLIAFIKSKMSNESKNLIDIATLNYDTSIYISLFSTKDAWFRKNFVDGFTFQENKIASEDKICQRILTTPKKARFLHLHGSYLYIESVFGKFTKEKAFSSPNPSKIEQTVVILSNQSEKCKLIKYHDVLNKYQMFFNDSLERADKLLVLGYGGGDQYLNNFIHSKVNQTDSKLQILIVDRDGCRNCKLKKWKEKFLNEQTDFKIVDSESKLLNDQANKHRIFFLKNFHEFDWSKCH